MIRIQEGLKTLEMTVKLENDNKRHPQETYRSKIDSTALIAMARDGEDMMNRQSGFANRIRIGRKGLFYESYEKTSIIAFSMRYKYNCKRAKETSRLSEMQAEAKRQILHAS